MILWRTSRLEKDCSMPDLQQSTDAELEELLASEIGDQKKPSLPKSFSGAKKRR